MEKAEIKHRVEREIMSFRHWKNGTCRKTDRKTEVTATLGFSAVATIKTIGYEV